MTTTAEKSELLVRVDEMSPVAHDVDLVVVGVVASRTNEPLRGSVLALDALLAGAVERFRTRDDVRGGRGGTRLLDGTEGIKARKVLLVFLGTAGSLELEALADAGRIAVRAALDLGVDTLGFAPGLRDAGVDDFDIGDVAQAIVRGAREAFDSYEVASRRSLVLALEAGPANAAGARKGIER